MTVIILLLLFCSDLISIYVTFCLCVTFYAYIVVEQSSALDSSSGVSDQQSVDLNLNNFVQTGEGNKSLKKPPRLLFS